MMTEESLFTKIVAGEIPCHRLYEDDLVFAFLDIGPLSTGHCLVIPKLCYPTLDLVPNETAAALGRVLPRLARAVMRVTGATAFNVLQNNGALAHQAVDHVHFHIIPRFEAGTEGASGGEGLGIQWKSGMLETGAGAQLAEAIRSALSGV